MNTKAEFSPEQKVYRLSLNLRNAYNVGICGIVSILSCVLLLLFLLDPQFQLDIGQKLALSYIWVPLALVSAVLCLWRAKVTLVISPEGIAYSRPGFRIFTTWDNVECISTRIERSSGVYFREHTVGGLKLRQPAAVFKLGLLARLMFLGVEGDLSLFIPISQIEQNWQVSQIAEDIRRYAPWALKFFYAMV